ncbi:hypothetical protein GCM10011575_16410 [Microlunatus endophyticus]|uniref:Uncharacterized protein n=1 Tax=Microlunatus endophyticus TaxID=1716077 RepID=A0A917S4X1_9ACTN|nr:hypothetical protein GCM10011575_16410 [Microlunatus endophyticus]
MGYQSLSGPEWLPGELDALFAREPEELEPTVPDPEDPWPVDVDDEDLGGWFDSDLDSGLDSDLESGLESGLDSGPVGDEVPGSVPDRFAAAVADLDAAVDRVAALAGDLGLGLAGRDGLVAWMQGLERSRNRLLGPSQVLINLMEAAGCRTDGPLGLFASPQAFLIALLGNLCRRGESPCAGGGVVGPEDESRG